MHLNSILLFERYAAPYFTDNLRVLELGPDAVPSTYRRRVVAADWSTADLVSTSNADGAMRFSSLELDALTIQIADAYDFPIDDESFDIVLSGQVIEHVPELWRWMTEVARVCRRGGVVITLSPVSWPYHPAPQDCWRIFPDGMAALCTHAGLEVEVSEMASLEPTLSRRSYPGDSQLVADTTKRRRILTAWRRVIGWPTATPVDLITIARKP